MPGSFGDRLRLRREEQGTALSAIADELKIKLSLLEALERDDTSHWPSGIYRRAFIRAYGQAIGLDPDVVVREFQELHPDPDETFAAAADSLAAASARPGAGPPTRLRNIVDSAIGSFSRLGRGAAAPTTTVQPPAAGSPVVQHPAPDPGATNPGSLNPRVMNPGSAGNSNPGTPNPVAPDPVTLGRAPAPNGSVPATGLETAAAVDRAGVDRRPGSNERDASASGGLDAPAAREQTSREASAASPADAVAESSPASPPAPIADAAPVPSYAPDLLAVAHLCTALGCARSPQDLQPLLQEAARILDATGLIVWLWDEHLEALGPALVHGYSEKVLAQLPTVSRDADNATAAAFRSAHACEIHGSDHRSGALVVPLMQPEGCAGVLAIELQNGREQSPSVLAVAMIVAAALTQLVGGARPADVP